jgi:hypothetical protein
MRDVYIFIAGVLSILILLPIAQSIGDIFMTLAQWIISIFNVHIAANNATIQDIQDSIQPTSASAIGFSAPSEEEFYDDEEDDPEENKFQTGFRG